MDENNKYLNYINDKYADYQTIAITFSLDDFKNQIKLKSFSEYILSALAYISKCIIDDKRFCIKNIFCSGGETAEKLLGALAIDTLEIEDEIMPLVVLAKIKHGKYNGINLITKGGLVGDEKTLDNLVEFMNKASLF